VLALTRAAERLGVRVRHGRVIGLRRDGGCVTAVVLEREVLNCATAVLALMVVGREATSRPPAGETRGLDEEVRALEARVSAVEEVVQRVAAALDHLVGRVDRDEAQAPSPRPARPASR